MNAIKKYITTGIIPYILLGCGLILCYALFSHVVNLPGMVSMDETDSRGIKTVKLCMVCGIFMILTVVVIALLLKKMSISKLIGAVIASGIVMRVGYMLYTPFYVHGHDVGGLSDNGHYAYIYQIFKNFALTSSNDGQFYHPPLHYILCAIVARGYAWVYSLSNPVTIVESARLVPCFASCALLLVCCKLFDEFKLDVKAKLFALSIIAFHPTFYLLSASINNDMLMIFFFMVSFLYTVRWYKNHTFHNIILLAVSIGCAMSTKLSGGLIAGYTAVIFILVAIQSFHTKFFRRLIAQLAVFASICFPLGLWYSIRNLILFRQGFGYVLQISEKNPLYIGYRSFAERFLTFPPDNILNPLCCDVGGGVYRVWIYTLKCSLFGEFSFESSKSILAAVLILANLSLIIASLAIMIYCLLQKSMDVFVKFSLCGLWLLLIASFIVFNLRYPFTCTMDFRYIVPTVITGAAFIGLVSSGKQVNRDLIPEVLTLLSTVFTVIFITASILFYTT